jgi:hypothetical protein
MFFQIQVWLVNLIAVHALLQAHMTLHLKLVQRFLMRRLALFSCSQKTLISDLCVDFWMPRVQARRV